MNWRKKWKVKFRRISQDLENVAERTNEILKRLLIWLLPFVTVVAAGIALQDTGFNSFYAVQLQLWQVFHALIIMLSILLSIRFGQELFQFTKKRHLFFHGLLACLFLYMAFTKSLYTISSVSSHDTLLWAKGLQYGAVLFLAITEISKIAGIIYNKGVSSALVFVSSFLFFIIAGTGLLLLPRSTQYGIDVIDALFMSTSAVCVTGLATIPLTEFSTLGQLVILGLLQIGGLGVMTFAGLLGHALSGKSSFQSQLALKDMISSNQLNNVVQTVYTIIGVSLLFELLGMLFIYTTVGANTFATEGERIYFSVFHAISAFCNAGFSTEIDGLATAGISYNYAMQWVIMILIILGGMGFPIVFNIYRFLLEKMSAIFGYLVYQRPLRHAPRILNITSRLALFTSLILVFLGTILYLAFEQNHSLARHTSWFGKITTAFFGSVTSRTAGFNTVDFSSLSMPAIMIIILLMWIGASPASTGGGIKTTTVAVAVLNMVSVIRGKDRTEYFRREITNRTIRRSFAIILLSLFVIGVCIFGVSIYDSDKGLIRIAFESFSAFSTVGLSMGITAHLSNVSKLILTGTMFFGRVGTLTLLAAIVSQTPPLKYRYPSEEILT